MEVKLFQSDPEQPSDCRRWCRSMFRTSDRLRPWAPGFNWTRSRRYIFGPRGRPSTGILVVSVSFKTLDLNLLKVFDAVMEERSVLRASRKVALSQSAVSHSLARLREMLEDDLFVRTATRMQPTARASDGTAGSRSAASPRGGGRAADLRPGNIHQTVHARRQRLHHDGAGVPAPPSGFIENVFNTARNNGWNNEQLHCEFFSN